MQEMTFEEFTKKVQEEIKGILPEKYADSRVDLNEVIKNNDTKLTALTVSSPEGNVAPTIYLEQYYGDYRDGHDFSDVLEEIAQVRIDHEVGRDMDVAILSDYEQAKGHIVPRIVNLEQNRELLENRPYKAMDDLAVTYHVHLGKHESGTMSAPVTTAMLEKYGVDVDTLHEQAVSNISEVTPSVFKSMGEVMREMMGPEFPEEMLPPDDGRMYILSNEEKLNGAAALLDARTMQEVSEQVGDFYILPSSIHETIIVPKQEGMELSELEKMVRDVNATQVQSHERLSDHVYAYDAETHEIFRADREAERQAAKEASKEAAIEVKIVANVTEKKPSVLAKLAENKEKAAAMAKERPQRDTMVKAETALA